MIDFSVKKIPLKVIFWGYHLSGWQTYRYLMSSPVFKVVGIVLPSNRQHQTLDLFKADARNENIPVFQPTHLSDEAFVNELKKLSPDLHFVDSYSKLIPKKLIDIADAGFNLHPGILPQHRGAHVLNWVLVNGEKETGLSLHLLTDKFDEGPLVSCEKIEISPFDTAADLDQKLIKKIPALIQNLEEQIKKGKVLLSTQAGESKHYPARTPKDGQIASHENAVDVYNKIRAVTYPWGGAYFVQNDLKLIVWQALPLDLESSTESGTFMERNDELFYVAGNKKLLLLKSINLVGTDEYKPVHGKEMIDMLRKHGLKILNDGEL